MNFRLWLEGVSSFEGSVVRDLVYHGTDEKPFSRFEVRGGKRHVLFSTFDVKSGGYFFSESPHDALEYGRNVASCYIYIKNPLLDPRRDRHLGVDRLSLDKEKDLEKILRPMVYRNGDKEYIDIGVSRYLVDGNWIYHAVGSGGLAWDVLDNEESVRVMVGLGYDGTFVDEDKGLGRSIFVPSADQVRIVEWLRGGDEDWGNYSIRKRDGYGELEIGY